MGKWLKCFPMVHLKKKLESICLMKHNSESKFGDKIVNIIMVLLVLMKTGMHIFYVHIKSVV